MSTRAMVLEPNNRWPVSRAIEECHEIVMPQHERGGIDQRMGMDALGMPDILVDVELDLARGVVRPPENGDRSRLDPQVPQQPPRRREAQIVRVDLAGKPAQGGG